MAAELDTLHERREAGGSDAGVLPSGARARQATGSLLVSMPAQIWFSLVAFQGALLKHIKRMQQLSTCLACVASRE